MLMIMFSQIFNLVKKNLARIRKKIYFLYFFTKIFNYFFELKYETYNNGFISDNFLAETKTKIRKNDKNVSRELDFK